MRLFSIYEPFKLKIETPPYGGISDIKLSVAVMVSNLFGRPRQSDRATAIRGHLTVDFLNPYTSNNFSATG